MISVRYTSRQILVLMTALSVVLIFFLVLLATLSFFFPQGPSLQELISQDAEGDLFAQLEKSMWVKNESGDQRVAEAGNLVATLTELKNKVKNKPAQAVDWRDAERGLPLYNQDSVQTFSRSSATLKFENDSAFILGANTLLVIKQMQQDFAWPDERSYIVMVDGDLKGKVGRKSVKSSLRVEVELAQSRLIIDTDQPGSEEVEFQVKVNKDKSSTVQISKGEAKLETANQDVVLSTNEKVSIDPFGKLRRAAKKAAFRGVFKPENRAVRYYRNVPQEIEFKWPRIPHAERYQFQLAQDRSFERVLSDIELKQTSAKSKPLLRGLYYWRMIAFDRQGRVLYRASPHRLKVLQDQKAPDLEVRFPPKQSHEKVYVLRGQVDLDAKVMVDGTEIKIDKMGGFEHAIELESGLNIIVVEAVDDAGNVNYQTGMTHGRF